MTPLTHPCPRTISSPAFAEWSGGRASVPLGDGDEGPARQAPYGDVFPAGVARDVEAGAEVARHKAPEKSSGAAAAISRAKACWANGASHESSKPKSPWATETRKPAMVARAKPTPSTAAHTRRAARISRPSTMPAIDCKRNSAPIVGIER